MLELSPLVTQLFRTIPTNDLLDTWREKVRELCAAISTEQPNWLDDCPVILNGDPAEWEWMSWLVVLKHLVECGLKLQVGNCKSYWFLKSQTSKWATIDGEHKLIELCFVSLFGDTFSGHATEYYPSSDALQAIRALRRRIVDDLTTKDSGFGWSVEEAIRLNGKANAQAAA
jgi:hypothetical protein